MLLRHLASILALPVIVILVIPFLLVTLFPFVLLWGVHYNTAIALFIVAIFFIGLGFILLFSTISLFVKKGEGTIAPWKPAGKLIITGFYSHVRNPMHIGVFLIITGESIMSGSISLIIWTSLFIIGNLIYVPAIEEKKLAERFGDVYVIYKRSVPRWIPRASSWKPKNQT